MKTDTENIPNLWRITDEPDVDRQMQEFTRAGGANGYSIRRDRNDRIRYNLWPGRTSDYKKHREALNSDPIPHEDAWDSRLYTADDIINDLGDVLTNAFARAQFDMRPSGAEDVARAANARKVLTKYIERDRSNGLNDEGEYLWQWGLGYGGAVWQVYWDRQVAMKMVKVKMDALMQAAAMAAAALSETAAGEQMESAAHTQAINAVLLPEMIADPLRESEAVAVFQEAAREMAAQLFADERQSYGDGWLKNYKLSAKQARALVRDLRNDGAGEFPAPYLHRNQPCAVAREVGYDYMHPPEMTDPEKSPWHIVRDWLTPAAIEENKITDGWNPDWCEAAIKTAGRMMSWGSTLDEDEVAIDGEEQTFDQNMQETRSGLVEVVWFYHRCVSDEGIPQIWCTVWCPHVGPDVGGDNTMFAKHYPHENAGSYGFFGYRWRKDRRRFAHTIGVPEYVGSDQASMKRSTDMLVDRQELEVYPPWLVKTRLGMRYKFGPGAQVPIKRENDVQPMPSPPGNPDVALKLIELTQSRLDNKFGLMTEKVLPARWQNKLQALTSRYLQSCTSMFKHYWRLIQEYADGAELARIAGEDVTFPRDPRELEGEFDLSLTFDVKDLDMEFVFKKLEAVGKWAVQFDRAGVVDMAGLVRLAFLAIDPTYAAALIRDERGASKLVYQQVAQDVAMMALGNEADYVENDPQAGMKLKFLQQIIQGNPRYQQALGMAEGGQPDQLFVERMTKYQENLQFSVTQEQNKMIGRIGVEPDNGEAVGQ